MTVKIEARLNVELAPTRRSMVRDVSKRPFDGWRAHRRSMGVNWNLRTIDKSTLKTSPR